MYFESTDKWIGTYSDSLDNGTLMYKQFGKDLKKEIQGTGKKRQQ